MDPNQPDNQLNLPDDNNPPNSVQPLSSQQAADLVRRQIESIYAGLEPPSQTAASAQVQQSSIPAPQPQQYLESNPVFSASQPMPPNPSPQIPPLNTQQQTQIPSPQPQPVAPPLTPNSQPQHFNPYHKATNPIIAANSSLQNPVRVYVQPEHTSIPATQPGGADHRNNYATFALPGVKPLQPSVAEPLQAPVPVLSQIDQLENDKQMVVNAPGLDPNQPPVEKELPTTSIADLKERVVNRVQGADKKKIHRHLKPLMVSLMVGLLFISINYNEVAVAQVKQYISPGDSISTPVILDPSASANVGPESKIIIPKINLDVPVIYGITSYDESQIQDGLQKGVVHYGTTAYPGEKGNNVIVGHSSNNYFNSGEYKFAFVLLFRLEKDDTFILQYKGQRYIYKVFDKKIISPDDFSLIQPTDRPITTLITCTPPGTSWERLVVQAEQISPNPSDATKSHGTSLPDDINTTVPGNAPSLWQRITDSIF